MSEHLTHEEWMRLRQALVYAWKDDYSVRSVVDGLASTVESIVTERVRAALREAAEAADDGDVRTVGQIGGWLRDRATAADPKDGAQT